MLNGSSKGIFVLFLILEQKQSFTMKYVISGFFMDNFYQIEDFPF